MSIDNCQAIQKSCIDRGIDRDRGLWQFLWVDCRSRFSNQYASFDKFRKSNRSYPRYYINYIIFKLYNSLRWPIYILDLVDITKLPCYPLDAAPQFLQKLSPFIQDIICRIRTEYKVIHRYLQITSLTHVTKCLQLLHEKYEVIANKIYRQLASSRHDLTAILHILILIIKKILAYMQTLLPLPSLLLFQIECSCKTFYMK